MTPAVMPTAINSPVTEDGMGTQEIVVLVLLVADVLHGMWLLSEGQ